MWRVGLRRSDVRENRFLDMCVCRLSVDSFWARVCVRLYEWTCVQYERGVHFMTRNMSTPESYSYSMWSQKKQEALVTRSHGDVLETGCRNLVPLATRSLARSDTEDGRWGLCPSSYQRWRGGHVSPHYKRKNRSYRVYFVLLLTPPPKCVQVHVDVRVHKLHNWFQSRWAGYKVTPPGGIWKESSQYL